MSSPPLDLAALPQAPGVYRFRDAAGRPLYIGRAVDLRRRVRSYWGSQRGRPRMRRMVPQIVAVEVAVCDSDHEAAWLERNLLEHRKPRWNRARGGLETPIYLRLDDSPRSPSLTAVHAVDDHVRHFGPYLGGNQVRLALSALSSIYPLAYARDGLTGAEQAMAAARGVLPDDRDAIAGALVALLERSPGAAADAYTWLLARRDDATKALEFELAGRLQAQLEALEWLTSPQRVTTQHPVDHVAAAWADGVLVEFGIVAGRVKTWTQRACAVDDADVAVAATRPEWVDFAQRNAELAAGLHALHGVPPVA
ncbi:MAG: GIY-YIG nuclease family protein [Solirubrobacteraceae bacterium]|nr:GIY-YIG nuclease family protein [Patulibacter sp.]